MATIGAWCFWLLPATRRYDPFWCEQFSRKAYWNEIQHDIRRYGWSHDDFGFVGDYGDKSWAVWIMGKAQAGQEIANCGSIGHKDAALKRITGNDAAPGTNWNTESQWLSWWSTNKEKSQVEWIQAGLRNYGVSVHIPPVDADHEPLLALLGNKSTNATEKIPPFVRYNAFRWLRDSGFQAIPFAMSNITAQTPPLVRDGVFEYGKFERAWPKSDDIGILEFIAPAPDADIPLRPAFFGARVQLGAYSLMVVPLLGGTTLLVYSWRRKKIEQDGAGNSHRAGQ